MTDDCTISQSFKEWSFPQGFGPLGEDPAFAEKVDPVVYEDAFNEGFEAGFDEAETESLVRDVVDAQTLREYSQRFPNWVEEQDLFSSIFVCDSDVRIDHPFINDERMWSLWASQDCSDYDLLLTVILSRETDQDLVGFFGVDIDKSDCREAALFEDSIACEITLKKDEKFGMLFQGGFTPVYYTTEWKTNEVFF